MVVRYYWNWNASPIPPQDITASPLPIHISERPDLSHLSEEYWQRRHEFWEQRYQRKLARWEVREIMENLIGFVTVLDVGEGGRAQKEGYRRGTPGHPYGECKTDMNQVVMA
jgi:hypothetical protein